MNKTYRSIWNEALGAWVATSELGSGRRKGAQRAVVAIATVLLAIGTTHGQTYYSVNSTGGTNENNLGAAGADSIASGKNASVAASSANAISMGPGATVATFSAGSVAIGSSSNARGLGALALGDGATAMGSASVINGFQDGPVAIGKGATAGNGLTVAIGVDANASGQSGVAVGVGSKATGTKSLATGYKAEAIGVSSTAVGSESTATGPSSLAAGVSSKAIGASSTALGNQATASGATSLAAGAASTAAGARSIGFGFLSKANADDSVALGSSSVVNTAPGVAGYMPTNAGAAQTAAINATTSTLGAVSVGDAATNKFRQINGVAAGTVDSDAVNVSQLKALDATVAANKTKYYSVNSTGGTNEDNLGATGADAIASGKNASARTTDSVVMGRNARSLGTDTNSAGAVVIGADAFTGGGFGSIPGGATGFATVTIGQKAEGTGSGAVAIGASSRANAASVALGVGAVAGPTPAAGLGTNISQIAIGAGARAGADLTGALSGLTGAIAIGRNAVASPGIVRVLNTMAIGNDSLATGFASVAFGLGATATSSRGLALGAGSLADVEAGVAGYVPPSAGAAQVAAINATTGTQGAVSVGDVSKGLFRQINGVAAGTADSDAVNVSQLKAVNAAVSAIDFPIRSSTGKPYTTTATGTDALAVGATAQATANNATAIGENARATTDNSVALGNGSTTSAAVATAGTTILGTNYSFAGSNPVGVVSVGSVGNERQVQNVAAGQLSASSTDAVNGSQLYATNQAIGTLTTSVETSKTRYYSVNDGGVQGANYNNDGASGVNAVASGVGASASGLAGVAVGLNATATSSGGVAIGAGALADRTGMNGAREAFSNVAVASTQGAISVGSVGGERQITNVAGGTAATDAVNVRQLTAVQQGAVNYATNPDGSVNYNQVTLGNGQASGGTTISNVAPGVAGTDAANVDQLNAGVAGANQYTDQKFNQTRADIDRVGKRASAGTAGAMAMANLPQAYIPGKSMLSVGVAGYDGESALALGVSKLSDNGRWVVKFSGTGNSRGKFGVGAGAGFHW